VDVTALPTTVPVRVHRSDSNGGPAGGWAIALRQFLDTEFEYAWVLDDDILPDPQCLEALWKRSGDFDQPTFVFPFARQPDGTTRQWGSWCAFLIAREVVVKVGLPREELFWWAEDSEYLQWRIPQAGITRRMCRQAFVSHDAIRQGGGNPTWKYYYETRNSIWFHLHVMHKWGWFPRSFTHLMGRAMWREKHGRFRRSVAIVRGIFDGCFSRLGIRYPVEEMRERKKA
jgi:GT2 family glycosyltransferase